MNGNLFFVLPFITWMKADLPKHWQSERTQVTSSIIISRQLKWTWQGARMFPPSWVRSIELRWFLAELNVCPTYCSRSVAHLPNSQVLERIRRSIVRFLVATGRKIPAAGLSSGSPSSNYCSTLSRWTWWSSSSTFPSAHASFSPEAADRLHLLCHRAVWYDYLINVIELFKTVYKTASVPKVMSHSIAES